MPDIQRVLRDMKQFERSSRVSHAATRAGSPPSAGGAEEDLRPGRQVFDLVTGQPGEVVDVRSAHIVIPSPKR